MLPLKKTAYHRYITKPNASECFAHSSVFQGKLVDSINDIKKCFIGSKESCDKTLEDKVTLMCIL